MSKKTKKLVPKLRFPEFWEAGEWEENALGKISEVITGNTPSTTQPEYYGGDKLFVSPADVTDHRFIHSTKTTLTELGYSKTRQIPANSILFVCIGSTIGKIAQNKVDCATNQQINAVVPFVNYSHGFIYYSLDLNASKIAQLAGRQAVPIINKSLFSTVVLNLPSPEEQQKIADCLSSVDDLISAQSQKVEALKANKKGLMQQLFPREGETAPRLRFPEFRDAGEWEVKPLGSIGINLDSKRVPITESERIKGAVPYYGASGIIDYVKDFIFDEELLCISEDGANLIARTYPIAFSITGKTWVNNHAHVLKFEFKPTQIIVENYLNAINLEDYLTGMAQPKLNRAKLDIIPIPLPERDEQKVIADCLFNIDYLISAESQKLEELKAHKKGLMQQLFPSVSE